MVPQLRPRLGTIAALAGRCLTLLAGLCLLVMPVMAQDGPEGEPAAVPVSSDVGRPAPAPPEAPEPASAPDVMAPSLSIEAFQRITPAGQKVPLRVSLFNLRSATVTAYSASLEEIIPSSAALLAEEDAPESVAKRLEGLKLSGRSPVSSAEVRLTTFYKDSWRDKEVGLSLGSGVYVVVVSSGGVQRRTWLAVSSRGLLVKQSPDKVLAWLTDMKTGQPLKGVAVAIYGSKGRLEEGKTDGDGLVRFKPTGEDQVCLVATLSGPPAFCSSYPPDALPPLRCYTYTDRPVYRPGHLVRFRGTLRAVTPQGYAVAEDVKAVEVKINAPGGGTVYQETIPANDWGTFSGEFQLAPEPPLGRYDLVVAADTGGDTHHFYGSFDVEAYRKPEFYVTVSMPDEEYLGGDTIPVTISAAYYFGSPVAGGKVEYEGRFEQTSAAVPSRVLDAAGLGSAGTGDVEEGFRGSGRLDKDGRLTFEVKTRYVPVDRQMYVSATVSELALRPQEASGNVEIICSKLRVSIEPDKDEYLAGETAKVQVRTRDREGNGISAAVRVVMTETRQDRQGRSFEERTEELVETDSHGEGAVDFKVPRPGRYDLEAWAKDGLGNPCFDASGLTVVEKHEERQWPDLYLSDEGGPYKPGDTAKVRVQTDLVGGWMLWAVEGRSLFHAQVQKVAAHDFTLDIPVEAYHRPNVDVTVCIVAKGEATRGACALSVPRSDKQLEVIIQPDKDIYAPADVARYTITTRDGDGQAVPAEVGLGVVDESLYAIREDYTPDPYTFFWRDWSQRVTTCFSMDRLYPGGGAQGAMGRPSVMKSAEKRDGGDDGTGPRVRTRFADTAYWGPSVVTGPDGRAQVEFEMPDNLTTWRGTARGLTQDAAGGHSVKSVKATLPLLVRLALPRFYVEGDEATAAAIVHNYTEQDREVKVSLTADGAQVLSAPEQTIKVEKDSMQRLTWKIRATGPDEARVLVSAIGGEGASDAMQSILPVVPNGVKNVEALAGMTTDEETATLELPGDAMPGRSELWVTLSPSLAGPIFEALEYLTTYPYGCAEQTMSGFLPDVIVLRTLKRLGVDRPEPKDLRRYVSFGLQKLLRYQHDDGGWHWWEFDTSDPYTSAYIVYGLKLADEAGYVAAHDAMLRGYHYLTECLGDEELIGAKAYLLWALARVDAWDEEGLGEAAGIASELFEMRRKLDVYSRASLALALDTMGRSSMAGKDAGELRKAALTLVSELEASAVQLGVGAYWKSDSHDRYSWRDNDVEVTSQVLQALLQIKPDSSRIDAAVRWLMATRRGKAWTSTKDTASAVLALTTYLEKHNELKPESTVRVSVGGKQVGEVQFGQSDVFSDPKVIKVGAEALKAGANTLSITKDGAGAVYWAARLNYLIPAEKALPLARGVEVKRVYRIPADDPSKADTQTSGTVVTAEVTIRNADNLRYVLLEEPIPAGCEVIAGDDEAPWEQPYNRREVWDNRVVWYFDYLPKGETTLSYALRTESPGRYGILPTAASLMYFPEVRGSSKLARMRVAEVAPEP